MKSPGKSHRNFRGLERNMLRTDTLDSTEAVTARFAELLRETFGADRHAVKRIARTAGSSLRTAENWYEGRNAPGLLHFLRLARDVLELKKEVARVLDLEADLDPMLERHMSALAQAYLERKGGA